MAIDLDSLRDDPDGDPFEALASTQSSRHEWRIDDLVVSEYIATIDKRGVRRRVMQRLRQLIEASGGIWLCVAAYPFPYRSAFNFRVDYDEFEPGDFDRTLRALEGYESASSHFVCGASYEQHPEALDRLRGLDVGSHGYYHHTYSELDQNLRNIHRGIEVLRDAGIEPCGFAAPHGRWNHNLQAALEELSISHSSEFSLAYDELPLLVAQSRALQVPVHPVCLGSFLEAAAQSASKDDSADAAARRAATYLRDVAGARYFAGEPVFLYGHPTRRLGRYPFVLRELLDTVSHFGAVWKTTLSEFASWWRQRAQLRLSVERDGEAYLVRAEGFRSAYRIAIEYWRGSHVAPMLLERSHLRFAPAAVAYQNRRPPDVTRAIRVDRPEGLKTRLRGYLDWERVTPIGELRGSGLRGLLKRTLRRVTR
jgi:peptidoglycan/xylan/chitin deacetylase (PgdA/CDA1 family)